jgi:hypothetical protein
MRLYKVVIGKVKAYGGFEVLPFLAEGFSVCPEGLKSAPIEAWLLIGNLPLSLRADCTN